MTGSLEIRKQNVNLELTDINVLHHMTDHFRSPLPPSGKHGGDTGPILLST